jgi:DNA repair protein RecO (recombination protein O)
VTRRFRTEAIVVSRQELGESDRIVTLLSVDQGKFKAVAPGARRSKRRFGGCLDLFCRIRVSVVDKGRGLNRLEEAELLDSHEPIRKDLVAIAHAGYLAELSAAFLGESDEASAAFQLLSRNLTELDSGPISAEQLRHFELATLSIAGFAPQLASCLTCGTGDSERWRFDLDQGGIVCEGCAQGAFLIPVEADSLAFLERLQDGVAPDGRVSPECMDSARDLLAKIIDQHLQGPLRSRAFLRQLAGK